MGYIFTSSKSRLDMDSLSQGVALVRCWFRCRNRCDLFGVGLCVVDGGGFLIGS